MGKIDLDELERLAAQATPGPWEVDGCNNIRIAPKGRPIVATIHDYDDYLPRMADVAYIVAACNSVPELIARVRELERQRVELAELAIYGNGCFDCPLEDVCLYKEELVRDSAVCSRLLIEWVEAAKEAE